MAAASSDAGKLVQVQQTYEAGGRQPGVPDMQPDALWAAIQAQDPQLVIVDVRTAAEQEVSALPGPTLSREQFEKVADDKYKQYTVITYCTAGVRSGKYAAELRKRGYNAMNLEGSILGWAHAGHPLVEWSDRSRTTKRVHVYGPRWALQPAGYEPVMFTKSKGWLGWLASWLPSRK